MVGRLLENIEKKREESGEEAERKTCQKKTGGPGPVQPSPRFLRCGRRASASRPLLPVLGNGEWFDFHVWRSHSNCNSKSRADDADEQPPRGSHQPPRKSRGVLVGVNHQM